MRMIHGVYPDEWLTERQSVDRRLLNGPSQVGAARHAAFWPAVLLEV